MNSLSIIALLVTSMLYGLMIALHPTSNHKSMTEPFPKTRRVVETAKRRSIEQTSDSALLLDRFVHQEWEMFVIWSFVVVSFVALFAAGYII